MIHEYLIDLFCDIKLLILIFKYMDLSEPCV